MLYSNNDYRAVCACENARIYEPEAWEEECYEEDFDSLGLLEEENDDYDFI